MNKYKYLTPETVDDYCFIPCLLFIYIGLYITVMNIHYVQADITVMNIIVHNFISAIILSQQSANTHIRLMYEC